MCQVTTTLTSAEDELRMWDTLRKGGYVGPLALTLFWLSRQTLLVTSTLVPSGSSGSDSAFTQRAQRWPTPRWCG